MGSKGQKKQGDFFCYRFGVWMNANENWNFVQPNQDHLLTPLESHTYGENCRDDYKSDPNVQSSYFVIFLNSKGVSNFPYLTYILGILEYGTTKFENDGKSAMLNSAAASCDLSFVPVLYNKTTSTPIVQYLAKFLSTPIVKHEKIADSRKMINPKTQIQEYIKKTLISN